MDRAATKWIADLWSGFWIRGHDLCCDKKVYTIAAPTIHTTYNNYTASKTRGKKNLKQYLVRDELDIEVVERYCEELEV